MRKTNKMTCAHSEDSDQPGHPSSLIILRCPHEETLGPQLPIERPAKTLIRLGGCPGWSEYSLGAHAILLVLSWGSSNEPCHGNRDLSVVWLVILQVLIPSHFTGPERCGTLSEVSCFLYRVSDQQRLWLDCVDVSFIVLAIRKDSG